MNKKLNLIGIKQLRLVEDVETTKEINTTWLAQQLANAGFTLKKSGEKEIKIFYEKPIISMLASFATKSEVSINDIKLEALYKFPLTKYKSKTLTGNELDGDGMKDAILNMIPSNKSLQEEEAIILPSQNMDTQEQYHQVLKYLEKVFKIQKDTSDSSGKISNLTLKKELFSIRTTKEMKVFNASKYKLYDSMETIMSIVAKNLGIDDLTSQMWETIETENPEVEQQEEEKPVNNFNRNTKLTQEELTLRKQLSKEIQSILNKVNEDYDNKNINIWNLAYSKCKDDKEKDILIQLFLNKKMNISKDQVERNFLGLREWIDGRGFELDKNYGLQFINNYDSVHKGQEIPSGSLKLLIDLTNRNLIQNGEPNILSDKTSLLYQPNIYNNLKENYNNLIKIFKMYYNVYNYSISSVNDNKKQQLKAILGKEPSNEIHELALEMCLNNNNLRPLDDIETIYSIITGKNTKELEDEDIEINLNDIIKDIERDNKLDSLPNTNTKTLKLVQDAANVAFANNKQARIDFINNLKKVQNG